jgi:hypothetical protein
MRTWNAAVCSVVPLQLTQDADRDEMEQLFVVNTGITTETLALTLPAAQVGWRASSERDRAE